MKVSDYLKATGTNGFMPVFENAYPETYQAIFGTIDPLLLDTNITLTYGGRELIDTFSQDTSVYMIKSIILLHADEWRKQADLLAINYNVLTPVVSKTDTIITESTDETGTGTDTKKSTTFDSADFGNDEQQEQSTTGNRKSDKTQSVTQSGIGNTPVSEIIRKEISLRKASLKAQVINDIMSELILSVY